MLKNTIICFFWLLSSFVNSQELNCQISIITDAKLEVTTTEQEALKQLEEVIFDFMNSTQWTKDKFKIEERTKALVESNFQIKDSINSASLNFQTE